MHLLPPTCRKIWKDLGLAEEKFVGGSDTISLSVLDPLQTLQTSYQLLVISYQLLNYQSQIFGGWGVWGGKQTNFLNGFTKLDAVNLAKLSLNQISCFLSVLFLFISVTPFLHPIRLPYQQQKQPALPRDRTDLVDFIFLTLFL